MIITTYVCDRCRIPNKVEEEFRNIVYLTTDGADHSETGTKFAKKVCTDCLHEIEAFILKPPK